MTVNSSARLAQVFIGGKDFSSCFISFQGSDSHLDQSGLITFTGSIFLGRSLGFDESLDDRKNTRFFRGQVVTIYIQDSQRNFRRHPRGALRIISPKYDDESQMLTLDVGDLTALLNFREPTDVAKTEIKLGTNSTSGDIISRLLVAAGINAFGGGFPSTIINYPINLTGSYLANVGKLLYANNSFGWIDKNEVFQVRTANIAAAAPAVTVVVGRDEIWYKRLDSAESHCEIIKAVGRGAIVSDVPLQDETSEQYGSANLVDKTAGSFTITIKKTTIKERWVPGQKLLITETTTKQPIGLVIPKELLEGSNVGKLSLITSEFRVDKVYYEMGAEGKLKKKVSDINRLVAPAIAEFAIAKKPNYIFNIFSVKESAYNSISYDYDIKGRLSKLTTATSEIAGNLLSGTDEDWLKWLFAPDFLTDTEHKVEKWTETSSGIWEYEYSSYQPLIKVKPDLAEVGTETGTRGPTSNKLDMLYASGDRQTSNSGQLAPPAPERQPPEFSMSEEDLIEQVTFAVFGSGSNLRARERTFSVEFLAGRFKPALKKGEVSISGGGGTIANNQLRAIALREGNLLQGRSKGQQIALPLSDAWFDYHPLLGITAVEKDGAAQAFLVDGCSWVVGQTRVLVSSDAIWVGTWTSSLVVIDSVPTVVPYPYVPPAGVATVVPYPYFVPAEIATQLYSKAAPPYIELVAISTGMGMGASFNGFSYALITITSDAPSGMGVACGTWIGTAISSSAYNWGNAVWETADWDNLAAESYSNWSNSVWDLVDWDNLAAEPYSSWSNSVWDLVDWDNVD